EVCRPNAGLRATLQTAAAQQGWNLHVPRLEYCTDNAAMIAIAAHYHYLHGQFASLETSPNPRLQI
ncbi:MAG: tRNA (adenosine(37)-N6)-threonylcarbamoyltransferase complex transferase subunit TsaD, partial [Cytophagales bacterium]|nr:tRNA (adenosine(37)-N6)-threonylcarbamoyltransferase complex transferase subunit TsaD [Cytophagales bacterium]